MAEEDAKDLRYMILLYLDALNQVTQNPTKRNVRALERIKEEARKMCEDQECTLKEVLDSFEKEEQFDNEDDDEYDDAAKQYFIFYSTSQRFKSLT